MRLCAKIKELQTLQCQDQIRISCCSYVITWCNTQQLFGYLRFYHEKEDIVRIFRSPRSRQHISTNMRRRETDDAYWMAEMGKACADNQFAMYISFLLGVSSQRRKEKPWNSVQLTPSAVAAWQQQTISTVNVSDKHAYPYGFWEKSWYFQRLSGSKTGKTNIRSESELPISVRIVEQDHWDAEDQAIEPIITNEVSGKEHKDTWFCCWRWSYVSSARYEEFQLFDVLLPVLDTRRSRVSRAYWSRKRF
jgi:hypothetical protein